MPLRKIEDNQNFTVRRTEINGRDTMKLQKLDRLISPEARQRFIKKLFGGDSAGFNELLAQLEPVANWSEAYRLMQNHFNMRGINVYQEDATQLSNLIFKRYFPNDEHI